MKGLSSAFYDSEASQGLRQVPGLLWVAKGELTGPSLVLAHPSGL